MFKGEVALVTGASRGIGRSIVIELAKLGCNVVINYNHSKDSALNVLDEVNKLGVEGIVVKADISKENEVKEMFQIIKSKFNRLDIVVNNAGIAIDNYLENKSVDEFRKVIDTNLVGTFIVSKYASKYMHKGSIINIASNNAYECHELFSMDYDASKAGIISLTRNLASSLPNIRVNAIAPGWINTDPVKSMNPDIIKDEKDKIIMNRFGEPLEVASVVCFLASDKASYINGSVIRVDGGIK